MDDIGDIKIRNMKKVTDFIGRWPSFHDAEVVSVKLEREKRKAEVLIYTFIMLKEIDERGFNKLEKVCLITLRFYEFENLELSGFNEQNVIAGLDFQKTPEGLIAVEFFPSYGFAAQFLCRDIEVVSVEPIRELA